MKAKTYFDSNVVLLMCRSAFGLQSDQRHQNANDIDDARNRRADSAGDLVDQKVHNRADRDGEEHENYGLYYIFGDDVLFVAWFMT